MNAATLTSPIRVDASHANANARPGFGRLTAVELRKMVDTRAGFWLLAGIVAITIVTVIVLAVVGDAGDHTFLSVLGFGVQPAAILLPIVGILLVTSEWSQRTGLITFTVTPVRSRILVAKLLASIVLALAALAVCLVIVVAGVLVAAPGVDGTWSSVAPMIGQSAVYLTASMVTGVAFGALLLASAPAIVANFALPTAWVALGSLSVFEHVGPWLDPALAGMSGEVLSASQWAHAGTSLGLWMVLPLLVGTYRITRREVSA
jgi:ABC-2 type transport system permease protein